LTRYCRCDEQARSLEFNVSKKDNNKWEDCQMRTSLTIAMVASAMFLTACASQDPEARTMNYIASGDAKMNQAITELATVDNDYIANDMKGATKAFNKAIGYVDDAVVDYAKAATSPDQKSAVDALKNGLDQIKKCVTALEKNDTDKAQEYYSAAQAYFDTAATEFWASE
jgi:ribosomal protein S20